MIAYSKEEILTEVSNYLDDEYRQTKRALTHEPRAWWIEENETKDASIKRALGVVMFVQRFRIGYEEVNALFEEFKSKIYKIEATRAVEHRGGVTI